MILRKILLNSSGFLYKYFVKKVLFLHDPEMVHESMTIFGETIGKIKPIAGTIKSLVKLGSPMLEQSFFNINFQNPIGLAAGFDYEAKLTQILPSIGFGFGTVGTITNLPYGGNPKPMLGRLPKSRSLMVNKGFKNDGIKSVLKKLRDYSYEIPIGISIGKTNTSKIATQKQAIEDIISTFKETEKSKNNFSYYELNISCPNLMGNISFYEPSKLEELLAEIKKLNLKKPLFIKMPIEKSDREVLEMLNAIIKHPVQGVIFGNLQKDRNDPALDPEEVKKFKVGYFSGKPTEKRSNELIKLAYKNFGKKLIIIGCGGVFNAKDAYVKIKLGASLVQMITGMIFEGPQVVSQINSGLVELLKKDGLTDISEAIGINAN